MSSDHVKDLEQLARNALAAWDALDAEAIVNSFAEDGALHPMMLEPIVGRKNLAAQVARDLKYASSCRCNIKNIAVCNETTVLVERVDEVVNNGKKAAIPVMASMDFRDGKITMWREYMDLKQFAKEMGWPAKDSKKA